jgi:hypothetical protein
MLYFRHYSSAWKQESTIQIGRSQTTKTHCYWQKRIEEIELYLLPKKPAAWSAQIEGPPSRQEQGRASKFRWTLIRELKGRTSGEGRCVAITPEKVCGKMNPRIYPRFTYIRRHARHIRWSDNSTQHHIRNMEIFGLNVDLGRVRQFRHSMVRCRIGFFGTIWL